MTDIDAIRETMLQEARWATEEFLNKHWGGRDGGACGFAWVTIYPEHKGNTKAGKAERAVLKQLGFTLDWTGKSFQYWNPSKNMCQSVDAKSAGAAAAAKVLQAHGFKAYAGDRLD
jgi:hypothetical protein